MHKYAIQVKDVSKEFSYSHHSTNSLKRSITQFFKQKDNKVESFYALDGVSFNVEKGDFFGILGRNGSGKSTLLKIISEIYRPSNGSVSHEGKLVSFIELGVGFKSELTGRENVYLNAALLGFSKTEINEMYDDIVSFAELDKFMDQQLKNYSSGMKVRLAFSVAIRAKADILILDEVLAVGDASFRKKCNNYFKTLKEDNKTVILVTHSMGDVREYCNKAIVIDDGRLAFEGGANEAASKYLNLFDKTTNIKPLVATYYRDVATLANIVVEAKNKYIDISIEIAVTDDKLHGQEVVFGMKVKDASGKALAGFNNLNIANGKKLIIDRDSNICLTYRMDNILGNGKYTFDATLRSADGLTVYDYIEKVETIENDISNVYYPLLCPVKQIEILPENE